MNITWSIITVTYNSAETLRTHWAGSKIPADVEWIVVDNESVDDSSLVAEGLGANVIRAGSNLGFSAANNLAFSLSHGRYIAFVNPDVKIDWGSLGDLQNEIDLLDGFIAPQLTNPDGSLQPNGRGVPSLRYKVQNRLGKKTHNQYRFFAEYGETRYVCWLTGAVIAASRDLLDRISGPWDDRYFLYYEDTDICLRAWRAGIPVLISGNIHWSHTWARETMSFSWLPWKRELASMAKFYARYPKFFFSTRAPREFRTCQSRWGTLVPAEAQGVTR